MAASWRSRFLSLMASATGELNRDFQQLEGSIERELRLNESRLNDPATQRRVRDAIAALILAYFLNLSQGGWTPFRRGSDGTLIPLSPFARLLWHRIQEASHLALDHQASLMRTRLVDYPDILRDFERATILPQLGAFIPPQDRVYKGRSLEDSIAFAAIETRRKVDQLLATLFAERRDLPYILILLSVFLTVGKHIPRTGVFGTTGTADAERILSSVLVSTHQTVGAFGASLNPFVVEVDWVLDSSHPCCDICDDYAANGPYAPEQVPLMPHPNCLCYLRYRIGDVSVAIERLRGGGIANIRGPLSPYFAEWLLKSKEARRAD